MEVGTLTPAAVDFDNLLRFFSSWTGNNADKSAPLQIADRVRDLAAQVLKGEILSLIDVAAFRDAIQDAIAQLVPTRAVFSYDFSKVVTQPPSDSSIFQAQLGAAFVLSMRLTVELHDDVAIVVVSALSSGQQVRPHGVAFGAVLPVERNDGSGALIKIGVGDVDPLHDFGVANGQGGIGGSIRNAIVRESHAHA